MATKLLFINGDADYSNALKTYIERLQFEVSIATTLEAVRELLPARKWGVILADPFIHPDLRSILATRKVEYPVIQLMILTSAEKINDAMDIFGVDAIHYLSMPVSSKALEISLVHAARVILMDNKIQRYSERLSDLHNAHDLLSQLFEEIPSYISVQDRNYRITAANRKFRQDFNANIGEFCYKTYKRRNTPCNECPVRRTFDDGEFHTTEEVCTSNSGIQYNVLTHTAPIRNEMGEITQVMEVSTNITRIRQLQDHLVSLGLMLGSMSHGVKGMLTALDGGIYQLESGLARDDMERVNRAFQLIRQMGDKIKKMVLEILNYAKSRELRYQNVPVSCLVENVITTVKPIAAANNVVLRMDVPDNLGRIDVDTNWMESALVNFLENAVDACVSKPLNGERYIEFSVRRNESDQLCFVIEDNGIGMDRETREKMFTLFFTSKGSRGTGLGTFIAHRVIKYHGGAIDVASEPGKGSRFTVTLPCNKPEATPKDTFPMADAPPI